MIRIENKELCCGCGACAQACPQACISLQADSEGFLYPKVDAALCSHCGRCEKVCPFLNAQAEREPLRVLAAVNTERPVRERSSSGGLFLLLARQTIARGGVVFGARFDDNWQVLLDYAEDIRGLEAFVGSKYVQARTGTAFRDAQAFLKAGRRVLFTGTPCQIAALRRFLGRDDDNLLAVDVVCHGVPSPKVWDLYLRSLGETGRLEAVNFRCKAQGWRHYGLQLRFAPKAAGAKRELLQPAMQNPYMRAFLNDLTLRPACYACRVKGGRSQSDLTLGDCWGIQHLLPATPLDDDRGTSLLLVNSQRGAAALRALEGPAAESGSVAAPAEGPARLLTQELSYAAVREHNPAVWSNVKPHRQRCRFYRELARAERSSAGRTAACGPTGAAAPAPTPTTASTRTAHADIRSLIERCLRPSLCQGLQTRWQALYQQLHHRAAQIKKQIKQQLKANIKP